RRPRSRISGLAVVTKSFGSVPPRVDRQHLAGDQSVEQQLLLNARHRVLLLQALHVGSSPSRISFIRGRVLASSSDTRGWRSGARIGLARILRGGRPVANA